VSKRCSCVLLGICVLLISTGSASAMAAGPGWEADSHSYPTNLQPGGKGTIAVDVYNIGAGASSSSTTVTDTLPEGVVGVSGEGWSCAPGSPMICTYQLGEPPGFIGAGAVQEIPLEVEVEPGVSEGSLANQVSVSGGGAIATVSDSSSLTIAATPAGFGLADADAWFTNANGTVDTQAGSHPYSVIAAFALNANGEARSAAGEEPRDLTANLPPGMIGDQRAAPRCTREQFDAEECPASTQVGVAQIGLALGAGRPLRLTFPLYNLTPPPGSPAQFGFDLLGVHAFFDASVRSGSDYGITVRVNDIPQRAVVTGAVTIWGVPSEPSHNAQRCAKVEGSTICGLSSGAAQVPFLTLPTSCNGPQTFSTSAQSWRGAQSTSSFLIRGSSGAPSGFTGCERLGFAPAIAVAPETPDADTPAGLETEVRTPVEGLLNPEGLATSNIADTTLTLPEGLVINPGGAAGLQACQLSEDGVGTEHPPSCPPASKVGTIEAETPVLENTLKGNVYLLASSPPNLQLLLDAAGDGVELKLIAHVQLNETTGRITTSLSDLPQAPIIDFKLYTSGGPQAALATFPGCGVYTATSDFTPWASPLVPDAFPSSTFTIASGSNGTPCPPEPLPFTPSMIAGTTSDQAGGFTDFSLQITHPDDQQRISTFQLKLPPGLLGMVSRVALCEEPQASAGTCSPASQIGEAYSQAGPGPYPLQVPEPGRPRAPIYLTGPYAGAPYGISVVVPAIVGPFDLGTVVLRGTVSLDPTTAAVTITTNPLPAIFDGVPPDLRTVAGVVNRPGFMFNPTNCSPMSLAGAATSTQGTVGPVQTRFQVGSCQALKFEPKFSVSTSGKTSKADGASLDTKLSYPASAPSETQASTQANIAKVKVELPKQLPARLTTLQQACPARTFDANPAACPAASVVGTVRANTPALPGQLAGPAYFVSNGGAKFPELVMVLQSGLVRVEAHGETFINKAGITSATFNSIPDAPISSFELYMPEGPTSALAANGNLCKSKLRMPTELVAQNGAVIHQDTAIAVTGCPSTRPKARKGLRRDEKKKRKKAGHTKRAAKSNHNKHERS
jgi:hypothetical protein